ncbi:MAG: hypothetical protein VYD81_03855, partial [Planctomycetota bacterium]|nr:hypothetical protein [Planctomycetota bacterium]
MFERIFRQVSAKGIRMYEKTVKLAFAVVLLCVMHSLPGTGRVDAAELFYRGDADLNGDVDLSDAIFLLNFLFLGGAAPGCEDGADASDDGDLGLTDAIYILNFLFLGGSELPPPSPFNTCPGPDPTEDGLGCEAGQEGGENPPGAELLVTLANAPGVRQRNRSRVERNGAGEFVVEAGTAFALMVVATRNELTRTPFSFDAAVGADPSSLDVRCESDLGDPAAGGLVAGTNLAPWFSTDVEVWSDRIYLLDHVTMRVGGEDAWSPGPGVYRFTAMVTDQSCSASSVAEAVLRVESSQAPEIAVWIEDGASVTGSPVQHEPGSGNASVLEGESRYLVIEARANLHGGPAVDPGSLSVLADPPFAAGADLSSRFSPVAGQEGRYSMRLTGSRLPAVGNTDLEISIGTSSNNVSRTINRVIESRVDYATVI